MTHTIYAYWRRVSEDMRIAYNGVCAYSSLWCSRDAATEELLGKVRELAEVMPLGDVRRILSAIPDKEFQIRNDR
ncbi:hypothetical protein QUF80_02990 [Desulfococcaceae bacterium HSG8]|nr:hypothetical protein [Desulfococcaceae bacterium HSG8]